MKADKKKLAWIAAGILVALSILATPLLLAISVMMVAAGGATGSNTAAVCMPSTGTIIDAGGPSRLPIAGTYVVTSEYGWRVNPGNKLRGRAMLHAGIDIATPGGRGVIVAAKSGKVIKTPTDAYGGNQVIVDHGGGLTTGYKHLSERTVTVGQSVAAGQQVGIEGATGNVTGPHLHFEVSLNGQPMNPRDWFVQNAVDIPVSRGVSATAPPAVSATNAQVTVASTTPAATSTTPTQLPSRIGPYSGVQLTNAALILKAGQAMHLDNYTLALGIAAAMGESTLHNLDHGDKADPSSRGLFQQIDRYWGTYEQRMNPTTAATSFYSALIKVPNYKTLAPTIAIHRTQNNEDPYHYTKHWQDALAVTAALTGDQSILDGVSPVIDTSVCAEGLSPTSTPTSSGNAGDTVVASAKKYLGTPYSWGGGTADGPSTGIYTSSGLDGTSTVGFDCSGLVIYAVYQATGITLAHSAEVQGQDPRGTTIPRDFTQMKAGDIISFSEDGSGSPGSFGHVGIYLGNGEMINAPKPGDVVKIVKIQNNDYWEKMAWSIKRYNRA